MSGVGGGKKKSKRARYDVDENGQIVKKKNGLLTLSTEELQILKEVNTTDFRNLISNLGKEDLSLLVNSLTPKGFGYIYKEGGTNPLEIIRETIKLEKISGLDDWVKFLIQQQKTGDDFINVLAELKEANRLAPNIGKDELVNIGGDTQAKKRRDGTPLPSFDITVENAKTGNVSRNIDVSTITVTNTINGVVVQTDDFSTGLRHALLKAVELDRRGNITNRYVNQGTIEATLRIKLPPEGYDFTDPSSGLRKVFGKGGTYTILEGDYSRRTGRDSYAGKQDLLQELAEKIPRSNPQVNEIVNQVNLVDRDTGDLIATLTKSSKNAQWTLIRAK